MESTLWEPYGNRFFPGLSVCRPYCDSGDYRSLKPAKQCGKAPNKSPISWLALPTTNSEAYSSPDVPKESTALGERVTERRGRSKGVKLSFYAARESYAYSDHWNVWSAS